MDPTPTPPLRRGSRHNNIRKRGNGLVLHGIESRESSRTFLHTNEFKKTEAELCTLVCPAKKRWMEKTEDLHRNAATERAKLKRGRTEAALKAEQEIETYGTRGECLLLPFETSEWSQPEKKSRGLAYECCSSFVGVAYCQENMSDQTETSCYWGLGHC